MANPAFQFFKDLISKDRQQMIYTQIPKDRAERQEDYVGLAEGKHYLRLYLAEMYLKSQVTFLQHWFPMVNSLARFQFGADVIEVPNVADASRVGAQQFGQGDVVARNYLMTPLIPFNSGTVQLSAALIGAEGDNLLKDFISTLSEFSKLLAVPQFSTALGLAGPLATGVQSLLNGSGRLHLGLNDTFGANSLGGYYVAIRATEGQVDKSRLRVENNQLRLANGGASQPFDQFDYMLFRLEVVTDRNDWDTLRTIQEPLSQARQAFGEMNDELAGAYYRKALLAVREAPELTTADRTRVSLLLKEDYKNLKENLSFSSPTDTPFSLNDALRFAISADDALERGEPSFDELMVDESNSN